jgi:hypothetical protein
LQQTIWLPWVASWHKYYWRHVRNTNSNCYFLRIKSNLCFVFQRIWRFGEFSRCVLLLKLVLSSTYTINKQTPSRLQLMQLLGIPMHGQTVKQSLNVKQITQKTEYLLNSK